MKQEQILQLVLEILKSLPQTRSDLSRAEAETPLFGPEGCLDSVELLSFVFELEQALRERTGRKVVILSDKALSQTKSPFQTASRLAQFIESLIHDNAN